MISSELGKAFKVACVLFPDVAKVSGYSSDHHLCSEFNQLRITSAIPPKRALTHSFCLVPRGRRSSCPQQGIALYPCIAGCYSRGLARHLVCELVMFLDRVVWGQGGQPATFRALAE